MIARAAPRKTPAAQPKPLPWGGHKIPPTARPLARVAPRPTPASQPRPILAGTPAATPRVIARAAPHPTPGRQPRPLGTRYVATARPHTATPHPRATPRPYLAPYTARPIFTPAARPSATAIHTPTPAPPSNSAFMARLSVPPVAAPSRSRGSVVEVFSPNDDARWLLGDSGSIQLETNGRFVTEESGVSADLLGGAALNRYVCWVVGKRGTILRTDDGGDNWHIVTPPVSRDFVSVKISGYDIATIEASNGERYVTRDGGRSWLFR